MLQAIYNANPYVIYIFISLSVIFYFLWLKFIKNSTKYALWSLFMMFSIAMILSITLHPSAGSRTSYLSNFLDFDIHFLFLYLFRNHTGLLNIGLFVPFGFTTFLAYRKFFLTVLAGGTLSVMIELLQGIPLMARTATIYDVFANTTGTIIGLCLGVVYILTIDKINK